MKVRETGAFKRSINSLNKPQAEAVDAIFGPVLVVAGPGTGKTQLLATRVGQILVKTDSSPQNILCLTFTESARNEMQERLARLIGPDGYKVAVHTFHSFGNHVMGTHGESFIEAFGFRAADDLTRYEIICQLLGRLPYGNPLGLIYQGEYLYLKDILQRIGQLRQAGLSADELATIVQADQAWLNRALGAVNKFLGNINRIGKKDLTAFEKLADSLPKPSHGLRQIKPIGLVCKSQLEDALSLCQEEGTRPITDFKNKWLTKNSRGQWTFKASRQLEKLLALSEVYKSYSLALREQKLYDYDDMILTVMERLEKDADLRAELQEQYQFILVDEYQDTSGAQTRLLNLLADNPAHKGQPNLMAVGDDDQAIYGFQGSYASNLLDFINKWRGVKTVVLKDNYRSTKPILDFNRSLIVQGEDRLENKHRELNKALIAHKADGQKPAWRQFNSAVEQYLWLAEELERELKNGTPPEQIAVLAPKHKHLEVLVPFLLDRGLPLAYEKRENVLEGQHIVELTQLAKVVAYLSRGEIKEANQLLPELLSYRWWNIAPSLLWELSLTSEKEGSYWLEAMRRSKHQLLINIAEFLLECAKAAPREPMELMLDRLIGPEKLGKKFASPFRTYYFPLTSLEKSQIEYVRLLSSLISLRAQLRNYLPTQNLKLGDFVEFVRLRLEADLKIVNDHPLVLSQNALQLMTAHKAKGQEFNKVYLINADEHTWVSEKGRINRIALPPNLVITPAGETIDEKLRLLYVAATRAKDNLTLTSFVRDDQGLPSLPLAWLEDSQAQDALKNTEPDKEPKTKTTALVRGLSFDWRTPHFELTKKAKWRDLLKPTLEHYSLNPTHLNAFLSVPDGGPKHFLVDHLLKFPRAKSVNAKFGDCAHDLMHRLHVYFNDKRKLPAKTTAFRWMAESIDRCQFAEYDRLRQLERGRATVEALYSGGKNKFKANQLSELNFAGEGVVIENVRLRGAIDRADINLKNKTINIVDYKTGKSSLKWPADNAKVTKNNSVQLYNLHKYRYQLLFYKLLVENSRTFGGKYQVGGAILEFLEPDEEGRLQDLSLEYDKTEIARLKKLIRIVWQKILSVDLPDTSHYPQNYAGVMQFEEDLLKGKV